MSNLLQSDSLAGNFQGYIKSSPELELRWGSWAASSRNLYYDGWKFEVNYDMYNDSYIVFFRSPDGSAVGMTERMFRSDLMNGISALAHTIPCKVTMGRDVQMNVTGKFNMDNYVADMSCEPIQVTTHSLRQLFKPEEPKLIVDQDDVKDLMDRILELQEPARQERIRERVKQNKQSSSLSAKFISLS